MTDPSLVTFGIKTRQTNTTYDQIVRTWREADAISAFEHAWLWDHLMPMRGEVTSAAFEAWTLLAALAALTTRLKLGVIVTNNTIRPPAVLAKMAATVDQISGGRLVFGIGAGGSANRDPGVLELVRREYDAYGLEMVPTGEAVRALGEACALIRRLWTESDPFDFDGQRYQLKGAVCEPKPVQRPCPPILVGATGPRSLRIVAEHADIWSFPGGANVAEFRRLSQILDDQCAAIGRDPATVLRSVQVLITPSQTTGPAGRVVLSSYSDPTSARSLLLELIDAGANHLVLGQVGPAMDRPARWLADEVVEPVRARLALSDPVRRPGQ